MPASIVAGNWKMNTNHREAKELVAGMKPALDAIEGVEKILCPPFIALAPIAEMLRGSSIDLGAQTMHHEAQGAFTGEISPLMLAGLCRFVILGHSERRQHFGETDEVINQKVKAALDAGLKPILCVGEQLREREEGQAERTVEQQMRGCLRELASSVDLVVAYEPVWAIGTGMAATPEVAQDMMAHVRAVLASLYGRDAAADVPLLYGGSVNPGNAAEFMREKDINGALVGGASLNPEAFIEIVEKTALAG